MESICRKIIDAIYDHKKEMVDISCLIHAYSELAFEEYKSSKLLADTLEQYGFLVERGTGKLDTAFKAVFKGKKKMKAIAFLAEYDALPGIGHGCGHNLIGTSSVYAAIALSKVVGDSGGNIIVIGTPAEEVGGGKISLLEEGVFDNVGYAIMAHPSSVNEVGRRSRAITGIHIEFLGKSAHSSAPEYGINALKAVINTFVGIDMVGQTFPEGVSTNGIITDGGKADNVIPEYARCQFTVRARTKSDLEITLEKFKEVIRSSEILTGAIAKVYIEPIYAERYPNMAMELKFKEHLEFLGENVSVANPTGKFGSSDIGNISLVMPIVHAYYSIMKEPVNSHSKDFAEKAISEEAFDGMVKASCALAMLGADLFMDESFRNKVDNEFVMEVKKQVTI